MMQNHKSGVPAWQIDGVDGLAGVSSTPKDNPVLGRNQPPNWFVSAWARQQSTPTAELYVPRSAERPWQIKPTLTAYWLATTQSARDAARENAERAEARGAHIAAARAERRAIIAENKEARRRAQSEYDMACSKWRDSLRTLAAHGAGPCPVFVPAEQKPVPHDPAMHLRAPRKVRRLRWRAERVLLNTARLQQAESLEPGSAARRSHLATSREWRSGWFSRVAGL